MLGKVFVFLCVTVMMTVTLGSCSDDGDSTGSSNNQPMIEFDQVISICNQSFPVTVDNLAEFNASGSFPDETIKEPMCYIKCYLTGIGILDEDSNIIKDKAMDLLWHWPNASDAIDDCAKEVAEVLKNNECEQAYYLARCVVTRSIVDASSKD